LHGLLEDTFLLEDEGAFFVVVSCTGGPAIAVPPCGPVVLKLYATAGAAVAALFATRGAFCSAGTAAEEGGIVSEMTEEERGESGKDYDDDDVFEEFVDVMVMMMVRWEMGWRGTVMAVVSAVIWWRERWMRRRR
jgi:hypothetical protein